MAYLLHIVLLILVQENKHVNVIRIIIIIITIIGLYRMHTENMLQK